MAFARLKRIGAATVSWIDGSPYSRWAIAVLCPCAFALVILAHAWVAEDAFITFRVIDNAVNGYGLRYNIGERVQVFTHPLWMLIHLAFYAFTREAFFLTIALSFTYAMATYALLHTRYRDRPLWVLLAVFLPLVATQAVRDYAISGLENPLSMLLLTAFFMTFLDAHRPTRWFTLSLLATLAVLNRFDNLWFLVPAVLMLLAREWRTLRWGHAIAGTLPLLGWVGFCFVYYGFVFPNTKYAKLNTGIGLEDRATAALHYAEDFFWHGMPGLAFLLFAALVALLARPLGRLKYLAFGLLLDGVYVGSIGGDYMSGRFFAVPVVLAVLLVGDALRRLPPRRLPSLYFVLAGLFAATAMLESHCRYHVIVDAGGIDMHGIANERFYYEKHNTLLGNLEASPLHRLETNAWVMDGKTIRPAADTHAADGRAYGISLVGGNAGMMPYFAGPHLLFIDDLGLTDPLLARLPVAPGTRPRIGHYFRQLPPGYETYRLTGDSSGLPPSITPYVRDLFAVASDPVWSAARWHRWWNLARGRDDAGLATYNHGSVESHDLPMARLTARRVLPRVATGAYDLAAAENLLVPFDAPLRFHAPQPIHATRMDLAAGFGCDFTFTWRRAGAALGTLSTGTNPAWLIADTHGLRQGSIALPFSDASGFDTVEVKALPNVIYPACSLFLPPVLFYAAFD